MRSLRFQTFIDSEIQAVKKYHGRPVLLLELFDNFLILPSIFKYILFYEFHMVYCVLTTHKYKIYIALALYAHNILNGIIIYRIWSLKKYSNNMHLYVPDSYIHMLLWLVPYVFSLN